MKTNWIWILIGITCCVILVVYFAVFNGNLSAFSQDWASFGSYLSGIMMPILTAINIWVFIKLTKAIDNNNSKRQQEETNRQDDRHNAELDFQRKKILTEMRYTEVKNLADSLDKLGKGCSLIEVKESLFFCGSSIDSFANQKQSLFPLEENHEAYKGLIELHKKISELGAKFEANQQITGTVEILKLKHKVIFELQQYILNNI